MNPSPRDDTPRGYYRFALYGLSGSGKTCVLASMARGAVGYPNGLTCTRLPVDVPENSGDPEAQALHRGKQWIDQAVSALKQGDLPSPNRPEDPGILPTVDFEIGCAERGTLLVRTVDYAGELINPEDESDPDSLASKLKQRLREYDDLILIVEAPPKCHEDSPSSSVGTQHRNIRKLIEAWASLNKAEVVLGIPVALMITKWDRHSAIDPDHPEEEVRRLADFLRRHMEYATLVRHIQNAAARQVRVSPAGEDSQQIEIAGGLQYGGCAVFPTSAFGKSEMRDHKECPALGERCCLGLLDAFVGVANRRDDLDAAALGQRWQAGRYWWWLPWPFFPGRTALRRDTARFVGRVPAGSAAGAMVWKVRRRVLMAQAVSHMLLVLLLVIGGDLGWGGVRRYQFDKQSELATRADVSLEQLRQARQWFRNYALASYSRWVARGTLVRAGAARGKTPGWHSRGEGVGPC